MSHPLATPRTSDVELVRSLLEGGHEISRDEAWPRWRLNDRRLRAAVSALRLSGYPVIASSGAGSTYRRAHNQAELDGFLAEIESRARSLEEQIRALRESAPRYFGRAEQLAFAIR